MHIEVGFSEMHQFEMAVDRLKSPFEANISTRTRLQNIPVDKKVLIQILPSGHQKTEQKLLCNLIIYIYIYIYIVYVTGSVFMYFIF